MGIKTYQQLSMLTLAAMLPLFCAAGSPAPQGERKLQSAEPRKDLVSDSSARIETAPSAPSELPAGKVLRAAESVRSGAPLRTDASVAARTDMPEPNPARAKAPAEQAATPEQLERYRGGSDTVTNEAKLNGLVTGNSAINIVTGANTISGAAFANTAGVPIVVQNSGANVLIQNSTIINVQLH